MNLRSASRNIIQKELMPYILKAVEIHPNPVDIKLLRGNVRTLVDYARKMLTSIRKTGVGEITSERFCSLRPRIRVYYGKGGIVLAALKQKRRDQSAWLNYRFPFEILPAEDGRWVTLAVDPSESEIQTLIGLLGKGVLESPIELRTRFSRKKIESLIDGCNVQVFKSGRNMMLWPKANSEKNKKI